MMSEVGRGFVTRAVMRARHLRVFFGLCVILTSCSVTYADELRHVKFKNSYIFFVNDNAIL